MWQAILNHSLSEVIDSSKLPKYVVLHTRKFEITELCDIFLGRWTRYFFLILLIGNSFLYRIALSVVVASSWAVNFPLNFADIAECNNTEFRFHTLPVVIPCRNAYWFCLFLFACIVIPLSMIGLKEQAVVQVIMGLLRFITVGAILVFCIANLVIVGSICTCKQPWLNYLNATGGDECNIYSTASQATLHFDLEAWTMAIPVMLTAFSNCVGIPVLTHPLHTKQKKHLGTLLHVLYVSMTTMCMMLGVVVSLWWKDCINETCTLSWVSVKLPTS